MTAEIRRPALAVLPARLCAGLDPVRPAADPRRRARRRARDRLGQYRRDQRAADRPQGPRRRHPAARRRPRARRRCCSPPGSGPDQPQFPGIAAIGAFLGHLYPVWLRFKGGKGVATLARHRRWLCTGRARCVARARSGWLMLGADPLFVGRRDDGGGRGAGRGRALRPLRSRLAVPRLRLARPVEAPRQYRAAARRHRAQSRAERRTDAGARRPDRPPAADPVGEYRPGHLFPAARPLRLGAGGARRDSRTSPRAAAAARRGSPRRPRSSARSSRSARLGARHLFLGQGLYPPLLAELETAPPALIVKGDLGLLDKMSVAIVGARNASAAACRFARAARAESGRGGDGDRLGPRARHRFGRA